MTGDHRLRRRFRFEHVIVQRTAAVAMTMRARRRRCGSFCRRRCVTCDTVDVSVARRCVGINDLFVGVGIDVLELFGRQVEIRLKKTEKLNK